MGFWGSASKFCVGRQEQVTARVIVRGFVLNTAPGKDLQNSCEVCLFLANKLQLEARKNTRGLGNCWRNVSCII